MIATLVDPNKNWVFHFGSLVKNEIPITIQEEKGAVTFFIPLDERGGLRIELLSFKKQEQIIEGKYTVTSSGHQDIVIFKIIKAGQLLRGTPQGELSRFVWTISSKT